MRQCRPRTGCASPAMDFFAPAPAVTYAPKRKPVAEAGYVESRDVDEIYDMSPQTVWTIGTMMVCTAATRTVGTSGT